MADSASQISRAEVIEVLTAFHAAFSASALTLDPEEYVISSVGSYIVRSEGSYPTTLGEAVHNALDAMKDPVMSGAFYKTSQLEVWTQGPIAAAMFELFLSLADGTEVSHNVALYTFAREDATCKISGTTIWDVSVAESTSEMSSADRPELLRPFQSAADIFRSQDWDALKGLFLPGAVGVSYGFGQTPEPRSVVELQELASRWSESLPTGARLEPKFTSAQYRAVGDLGFVWTQFGLALDGKVIREGTLASTMLKQDERWMICESQTVIELKE